MLLLPPQLNKYFLLDFQAVIFNLLVIKKQRSNMERPLKQHKPGQYCFTKRELKKLVNSADNLRDRVILKLLSFCGLRREEVASLHRGAIDYSRSRIRIIGKGGKSRIIPLSDTVLQDIKFYLDANHRFKRSPWLFPARNKPGKHLATIQINRIVAATAVRAKMKNPNPDMKTVNPHMLRHSFVRILKKKGVELAAIKEVLGHKDLRTTEEIYGLPSIKEIHKAVVNAIA